jgi:hypothetical protein
VGGLEHIEVVGLVSLTQAKRGDFAGALRTAALEKFPENAASLYTDIAEIQAENGDGAGALRTVVLIMPERRDAARNQVQLALARGLWKRGEVAEARRILAAARQAVAPIADTERKDGFFRDLVRLEAGFKDLTAALADAARIEGEYLKAETQKDLAKLQAEQGDVAGAVRTAAAIQYHDPTMTRNDALWAVAKIQAKQGDVPGAWRTAEMMTGERAKDSLRRSVAEDQVESGDFAAARKTIALIRDSFEERQALEALDAALAKRGDRVTLWLQRLADANLDHDGALNAGLFLDQAAYLRSLAAAEEPKNLFSAYYRAYIDLGDAEKIILQLLQPPPAP